MMSTRRLQRGYSLAELLTVMAIIGVLSLVTVPAFMNYAKTARLKNSLRQVASDTRAARQRAVSTTRFVRLAITRDEPAPGIYEIQESTDGGTTFTPIANSERRIQEYTRFDDVATVTFRPNGTAVAATTIVILSDDTTVRNSYSVIVTTSGKVSTQ